MTLGVAVAALSCSGGGGVGGTVVVGCSAESTIDNERGFGIALSKSGLEDSAMAASLLSRGGIGCQMLEELESGDRGGASGSSGKSFRGSMTRLVGVSG